MNNLKRLFYALVCIVLPFLSINGPLAASNYSLVSTLSGFPSGVDDVKVSGSIAYVVSGATFFVIDVSNTASPVVKGTLALMANGIQSRIALAGTRAYVTADINTSTRSGRLYVVDISNTQSPALLGTAQLSWPYGLAVRGDYVYVSDSGLKIFDISSPASPALLGTQALSESNSVVL